MELAPACAGIPFWGELIGLRRRRPSRGPAWYDFTAGIWTWLDRFDPRTLERVTAGVPPDAWLDDLPFDDRKAAFGHVAGIHTHRAWYTLHVALAGEEAEGPALACHVVWTSPGALEAGMTAACFAHSAETVRDVADYLRRLDVERVVADLAAARELGLFVYSFDGWGDGQTMVECGLFQRVFREVVDFYVAAAADSQVVVVRRG